MSFSPRTKVAVLRGGPSNEYEASLKTGANILSILREMPEKYEPIDIFISKNGEWHREGLVDEPYKTLRHVDTVWNALHGAYGEDGQVQRFLENMKIPYTGSGSVPSALAMNKEMAKNLYKQHSLLTPEYTLVARDHTYDDKLAHIFHNYVYPVVVKPAARGSSQGVRLVQSFNELGAVLEEMLHEYARVLVEEFISGSEVTCSVIEQARGEKVYAPLPVSNSGIKLTVEESKEIESMAKQAHEALGLRHYSDSDFIVTPRGRVYILETNSQPIFYEDSLLDRSLVRTGWKNRDFVEHILILAK